MYLMLQFLQLQWQQLHHLLTYCQLNGHMLSSILVALAVIHKKLLKNLQYIFCTIIFVCTDSRTYSV